MGKKCLKCGYQRTSSDDAAPDYACPNCDAVYAKVAAALAIAKESDGAHSNKKDSKIASSEAPMTAQPKPIREDMTAKPDESESIPSKDAQVDSSTTTESLKDGEEPVMFNNEEREVSNIARKRADKLRLQNAKLAQAKFEAKLEMSKKVKQHTDSVNEPLETPFIARVFYWLAIASVLAGLYLFYEFLPGDLPKGGEWNNSMYIPSIALLNVCLLEALLFAAISKGITYLHGIHKNTRSIDLRVADYLERNDDVMQ